MTKIPPLYMLMSEQRSAQFTLNSEGNIILPLFSTETHATRFRDVVGAPNDYTPWGFNDEQNLIEVLDEFADKFDFYAINPPLDQNEPYRPYTLDDTKNIIREKAVPGATW